MLKKGLIFITFLLVIGVYGINAQVLGDVNGDQNIDILDALSVALYFVGITPEPFIPEQADVIGCDGNIDIVDALTIAQYYVGLIDTFPCSPIEGVFNIELIQSGGFTGWTNTYQVNSFDKELIYNEIVYPLNNSHINQLMNLLNPILYATHLPDDTGPCCCDRFQYEFSFRYDHPNMYQAIIGSAKWTDCTKTVPESLTQIIQLIYEIVNTQ